MHIQQYFKTISELQRALFIKSVFSILEQMCMVIILAEATDPVAGRIRPIIHGGQVNNVYNRSLSTWLAGK